jgi:hypothetical protein
VWKVLEGGRMGRREKKGEEKEREKQGNRR